MKILPTEFDGKSIRRVYDESTETWWFSVIDVVQVLTQQADFQAARQAIIDSLKIGPDDVTAYAGNEYTYNAGAPKKIKVSTLDWAPYIGESICKQGWVQQLTVALLAISGQVLQLFHILPLLILLGLGVDYGIFLLEQPGPGEVRPFLSVTLAAASTLLSFGLLALSGTPALHAFGLTLLIGVFLAWLLTPLFLPSHA